MLNVCILSMLFESSEASRILKLPSMGQERAYHETNWLERWISATFGSVS